MNNAKEKASEISCNEPSKSIAMSEIRDKIKVLDDKIVSYENEIKAIEGRIKEYSSNNNKKQTGNSLGNKTCEYCDLTLESNYQLEVHMTAHEEATIFTCDSCEKSFYSKWRLKVHETGHQKQKKRCCHFYNNKKECPFEKMGCKFEHIPSNKCKFGLQCEIPKCQFQHQDIQ